MRRCGDVVAEEGVGMRFVTVIARVVVFALGVALVLRTLLSAIRIFVVPRSIRDCISSAVFRHYDTVLLALARLTMAPPAPWTSDRPPTAYSA